MSKKLNENAPQLRFPEFKEKWELKRLAQLIEIKSGYAFSSIYFSTKETDKILLTPGNFHVNGSLYFGSNTKYYQGEVNEEYILSNGDLLIVMTDLTKEMNILGNSIFLESAKIVLHNQRIGKIIIRDNLLVTRHFLRDILNLDTFKENIRKSATGSTVRHTSNKSILSISTFFPSIAEQEKIASFLGSIDTRLTQLRRKQELLQTYKRGVMQKIFSQELRFKDATGSDFPDWEEKKLGEIAKIKRGASPRPISSSKWFSAESNIGWVRISDVTKSEKYLKNTEQYLSNAGIEKSKFIPSGNLIMSICATIGKPIITKINVCIHDGFVVFEDLQANTLFVYFLLTNVEANWKKYGQPGIQLNLNTDIVSNEPISLPSIKEQEKIADFLTAIDKKIEAVAQQIDRTEQFKKGLLQKMFV